ncbi:MAG TPA: LacI family DNA-binding transcriptional regulator [Thermomicrobiales bacterium]|nr:LacI family DNA-binding transcriptional regulator [Thermomicrobiales bacterium]
MKRQATIDDIAAASGCSPATVSLALRNKPGVSRATRERILSTARALGYQRVQSMPTADRQTLDVAIVFRTWGYERANSSPNIVDFYSWVLTGLQESAGGQGINLLLANIPINSRNEATEYPERLLRQPLDGVILVGSFRPEVIAQAESIASTHRPPMILVDCGLEHHDMDSVDTANWEGGYQATRHLIANGHRKIAYLGPVSTWEPSFRNRREGYLDALRDAGLTTAGLFEESPEQMLARDAGRTALNENDGATAFFCANDDTATALMRNAASMGIRIPADLSVLGFDDIIRGREAIPPLTTMGVDKHGMGRHAMYILGQRTSRPESVPIQIMLRPRLVERESVRRLDVAVEAATDPGAPADVEPEPVVIAE